MSARRSGIDGLNAIEGVRCALPEGAFYAFPNIQATGMSSKEAADTLLYEAGVAVLSGTAFGSNGEGYFRMSLTVSDEEVDLAVARLTKMQLRT